MTDLARGFENVDGTDESQKFTDFLQSLESLKFFQDYKKETFRLLQLGEGTSILELGCGIGGDAIALAQFVGTTGKVIAVDHSVAMLEKAKEKAKGLDLPLEFVLAEADCLPFDDNTFNAARIDRVLMHVPHPQKVIAEVIRVLRPHGQIVAFDPDWETLTVNSENRAITRQLLNFWCDTFPMGWVARYLTKYFKDAGLINVQAFPRTLVITELALAEQLFEFTGTAEKAIQAGIITQSAARAWIEELNGIEEAGALLSSVTGFIVVGIKSADSTR